MARKAAKTSEQGRVAPITTGGGSAAAAGAANTPAPQRRRGGTGGRRSDGAAVRAEVVPLGRLVPDDANARQRTDRNREAIKRSLERFGPGRSIVIDGDNIVRAGNGTLEGATEAGMTEVIVVEPGPNQLVAVRRSDWSPVEATAKEIRDHIANRYVGLGTEWILLTGGEPAEQPIGPLVAELDDAGYSVCLETSGTAPIPWPQTMAISHLCLSPKLDMPGGKPLLDTILTAAHEIKMVIGKPDDIASLKALIARRRRILPLSGQLSPRVSIQPLSGSTKATQLCIDACLENGWNLSIQTHKLMGLR